MRAGMGFHCRKYETWNTTRQMPFFTRSTIRIRRRFPATKIQTGMRVQAFPLGPAVPNPLYSDAIPPYHRAELPFSSPCQISTPVSHHSFRQDSPASTVRSTCPLPFTQFQMAIHVHPSWATSPIPPPWSRQTHVSTSGGHVQVGGREGGGARPLSTWGDDDVELVRRAGGTL
jgi:hypothetical protein